MLEACDDETSFRDLRRQCFKKKKTDNKGHFDYIFENRNTLGDFFVMFVFHSEWRKAVSLVEDTRHMTENSFANGRTHAHLELGLLFISRV